MLDMDKVKKHFKYEDTKASAGDPFGMVTQDALIIMMLIDRIEELEVECEKQKTNRWQNHDLAVARKLEIQELTGRLKYVESKLSVVEGG